MARGRVAFKERDLARALRAAQKSGVPMQRIEIDREGRIVMIPGTPSTAAPAEHNPWDEDEVEHSAEVRQA
jgi:hypothetical protein